MDEEVLKPEEQEETEEPLHPRHQAIKDEKTCGHCHAHYPPWAAINVPIPPQPKSVQVPGYGSSMPCFFCINPDSPYFNVLLSAKGSCGEFMAIPDEVKKKPGEEIILPT